MSRFTDDLPLFGETSPGPPATATILLSRLGVSFAPIEAQREAVAHWLKVNKPGEHLIADLQKRSLVNVASGQRLA